MIDRSPRALAMLLATLGLLAAACGSPTVESGAPDSNPPEVGPVTVLEGLGPANSSTTTTPSVDAGVSLADFPDPDVDRVTIAPLPEPDGGVFGGPTTAVFPPLTGWEAFDDYIAQSILARGSNAVSVALAIDGEIVHRAAMGIASPGSFDLVGTEDRFRIASISKPITAITMLQLVEEGVVGLDDPVGSQLAAALGVAAPDARTASITPRQLMTHTSGFAQYEDLFFRNQVGSCSAAASVALGRSLRSTPGTSFEYSNMNFCALGMLIEQLTGQPYEQVVYERLLTPLGISGMRLAPTFDPGPGEVEHYTTPGRNYMEVLGAAGAWIATPSDLVTIIDSLDPNTPGWKPLEPETVVAMKTSVNNPLVPDRGYGMGMILYGGGNAGHTGTIESTHAMVLDRADNVTWAITVSGEYPSETPRLAQIMDEALFAGGFIAG